MKPVPSTPRQQTVAPAPRSRIPRLARALLGAAVTASLVTACGQPTPPTVSRVPAEPTRTLGPASPVASSTVPGASTSLGPGVSPTVRLVGPSAPVASPTASAAAGMPRLFPLPAELVSAGAQLAAVEEPATAHTAEPGRPYPYTLQHCGVFSRIDFDASLWDPVGAQNGQGGPITDEQTGELVNSSTGTMTLVGPDASLFRTSSGLILGLARHAGPKRYPPCA